MQTWLAVQELAKRVSKILSRFLAEFFCVKHRQKVTSPIDSDFGKREFRWETRHSRRRCFCQNRTSQKNRYQIVKETLGFEPNHGLAAGSATDIIPLERSMVPHIRETKLRRGSSIG